MRRAQVVFAICALLTLASAAAAQDREYIRLLEKLLVGASGAINAEITDLRRQLARCDGPANQRLPTDNCATRTLIQAQLNYLLRMGMAFGDPDTAGTPAPVVRSAPRDLTDFKILRGVVFEKVQAEATMDVIHVLSEDRAKLAIIDHCAATHDLRYLGNLLTNAELAALPFGEAKVKADVYACINEYDAREVSANRKAAIEHCFQSNSLGNGTWDASRFDRCMDTHDMLQAMCKRHLELQDAYAMRKNPQRQRAPQTCKGLQPNPTQIQAILAAPAARTMAELPPRFFAPPDVVIPSRPRLAIPAGTVVETFLQGGLTARGVEDGAFVTARLQQSLVVGGQTVLPAPLQIILKTRIVGPGARPDTVQIGLTFDEVGLAAAKFFDLKSNELVFTLTTQRGTLAGELLPHDTRLRFTIVTDGASTTPSAQAAPLPPTASAPPPAAAPPAPGPADRQQQADERRKQAERQAACVQQAVKQYPQGGLPLAQAIAACTPAK